MSKTRILRIICIPLLLLPLLCGLFARAGLSASNEPSETPDPTCEPIVIELENTPAPIKEPLPSFTPSPTLTPTLAPTPTPNASELEKQKRIAKAAATLADSAAPNRMTSEELDAILQTLPSGLSIPRTLVVVKAYSLIGKVSYQWGGKSYVLGWDERWGTYAAITRNGAQTVSTKPTGLDCSGFVRWCFSNAYGDTALSTRLGSGTYKQWLNCVPIDPSKALPGDLMFTNEVARTNHNGIVVQNDGNGNILLIHCVNGNGIVLESAQDAGFLYARRPKMLFGAGLDAFEASIYRCRDRLFMADLRYILALRA